MPLDILISGAGIGGPALAIFLQGANPRHNITVVERTPSLRLAGQQIDLKTGCLPILRKMGLLDIMKAQCVPETGVEFLDSNGKTTAHFGIVDATKGGIGLTSEYEIMRGDMVKVLYDASLRQRAKLEEDIGQVGALTYEFDKTITALTQSDSAVDVTFSDGQEKKFDMVVAADGQGSRTRRLAFGQETSDEALKSLGMHSAYYSVPRIEGEGGLAKYYTAQGGRVIMTRTSGRPVTQVYLFTKNDTGLLKDSSKEPIERQKETWAEAFKDAGWQWDRFLSGMKTCDDFYAHEVVQVKPAQLHRGRVVLLGDSGYCPSPFTGLGTTLALIGAYVLAGELTKHENDVVKSLEAYGKVMRAPIDEYQRLPRGLLRGILPATRVWHWVFHTSLWAISTFKIDQLAQKVFPEDKGRWKFPEYPGLNLKA